MFDLRKLALIFVGCLVLAAQDAKPEVDKLAPYYPTPETIVERMLQLGGLKAGEKMFDLGSGDGRIVIMAAQKYHADATGIEFEKDFGDLFRRRGGAIFKVNVKEAPAQDGVGQRVGEALRDVLVHPLVFLFRDRDEGGNGVGCGSRRGGHGPESGFEVPLYLLARQ